MTVAELIAELSKIDGHPRGPHDRRPPTVRPTLVAGIE